MAINTPLSHSFGRSSSTLTLNAVEFTPAISPPIQPPQIHSFLTPKITLILHKLIIHPLLSTTIHQDQFSLLPLLLCCSKFPRNSIPNLPPFGLLIFSLKTQLLAQKTPSFITKIFLFQPSTIKPNQKQSNQIFTFLENRILAQSTTKHYPN